MATRTLFRTIDREVGRETGDSFLEADREWHLDVRAALRLRPRRLTFSSRAAKKIGKDVAEA